MSERILIVDDDPNICEILEFNLKNENFEVEYVYSGEKALDRIQSQSFDLILLDVMMGGLSGYKVAETLRTKDKQTPIIFLTAKDTENDMLTGFSVGADDYISKPFSIKEVIARVKAVIKRTHRNRRESIVENRLVLDEFIMDFELKELIIHGEKTSLTKTEFEILSLLAKHPEKVYSREDIINVVWEETPYITERTVDVHITRLRKKLGKYASLITNRSGYGYRFNSEEI